MKKEEFTEKRGAMAANSIDELIDLLRSDDLQTRFFAEMCLRDANATWLNFQPASSPEMREKSIEKWRKWWKTNKNILKKRWKKADVSE